MTIENGVFSYDGNFEKYEKVTVANASKELTATTYVYTRPGTSAENEAFARIAQMRLETAQIRFRLDGAAPTTTEGTLLEVGEELTIRGYENIRRFRGIRTGATSGVLRVHYGF